MSRFLLDTNAWIWANMEPEKLSVKTRKLLSNPRSYKDLLLSAISIWEFSKLVEKRRIQISCHPEKWIWEALDMPCLRVVPITPTIAIRSTMLPQPFHNDPADQIIVATAREKNAVIITADRLIRSYKDVKCFW